MIRPVIAGVAGVAVVMLATGWASPANMVASASGANDPVTGPGPDAPSHVVIPARAHTATAATLITVGRHPFGIVITPNGKMAYVADSGPGTVTPIRTATGTALEAIKV